jgi:citrate synthase
MAVDRSYLTAAEAARTLGVSRPTLYAYASRGQLRSEPVPGDPRVRRYHRDDIERLLQVKAVRRDPQGAGARGLRWGNPVLESAITLIDGGRLYFRGRDAVDFATSATLDQAALLLWEVPASEQPTVFAQRPVLDAATIARIRAFAPNPLARMQIALALAATVDLAALDLSPRSVRRTAARIVHLLRSLVPWPAKAADVVRTALVLCADHELNVSAFTARCIASAGASPYEVVSGALAALKGYRHGGASQRALALLAHGHSLPDARAEIAARLSRGERIPGFGHPLYPGGDPRAALLLRLARTSGHAAAWRSIRNVWKAGEGLLQEAPNVDLGLAAITRAYGLPAHAPILLFALGRTVGWIAHALEEYASGQLIRPRARYVGPPPSR